MSFLEGLLWLTLNIYHEARSEPQIGQLAVAYVTLNRAERKNQSIRQVVTAPHQFSWTSQKKSYFPNDQKAFMDCLQVAWISMVTPDSTSGATFYHRYDIHPGWDKSMTFVGQYGAHWFYKD